MPQQTNAAGLRLIESFQGLRLTSYQDNVGVWTIGYDHAKRVHQGQAITGTQNIETASGAGQPNSSTK